MERYIYIREEHSDGEDACDEGHVLNPDGTAHRSERPPQTARQHSKMRQKRSKAYRKLMSMFSTSFGFRQPYQVLGAYEPL